MAIDSESQIIYVSGGRIIDGDWETVKCAGLYSYNVRLSKWKLLQLVNFAYYALGFAQRLPGIQTRPRRLQYLPASGIQ